MPTEICDAKIIKIQTAKAIGEDAQRPITGWQPISLPDTWKQRWSDYNGSVWYQIDWQYLCPNKNQTPIGLNISSINMAGQIYLNNELLWQDRSLKEPLSRSWNLPRYLILPVSALNPESNTLWIRVTGQSFLSAGLGQVDLGQPHQVLARYEKSLWWKRSLSFIRFGGAAILGGVCFFIWLFRRQETAFGWFALGCFFWLIFNILFLKTETAPFSNILEIAKISVILQLLYMICFCLYTWRFSNNKFPYTEKFLWLTTLSIIFLTIFIPNQLSPYFLSFVSSYAFFIFFINCVFYPYIAFQSKQIEQYLLAGCLVLFTVTGLYQFIINGQQIGQFFSRPIAPATAFFLAISIALRLSRNFKQIENFNHILEENIKQVKHELSSSLNIQHQLELQNTRLQERIHLAHDLHDSLGGALVRSMIMIDQSQKNLNNKQFLSILKLLRDDLRQVIDSGSSNGAKVPETPILWGASIRRRFSQLFDELDIGSTWSFPDQWKFQLTAFECLTLLRVVEEVLTNIIKHSQAKNVRVSLYYVNQHLVLEIEDDGIGFDIEAVRQSGISVGIRSMQIRLEKIQAYIELQSSIGKTLIKAIKPNSSFIPSLNMDKINHEI